MADEKKLLFSIKFEVNEALKNMSDIKKAIEELKEKQKQLDTSTEDGRKAYEAYGADIRQLTATYREQAKVYDNAIKAQKAEKESLDQLKARLSSLTSEYNKLSKEQRNSESGIAMKNTIKGITDELKDAEGGVGNFRRSVGEYENSIKKAIAGSNPFMQQVFSISDGAKEAGESFGTQATSGVKTFGKAMLSLLANPIVLIIAAIVAVVMVLYNLFKDFAPIVDKVEQVFAALTAVWNTLKSTAQQLFTGVLSLKQAFSGLGESMKNAATEAYKLKQAQQDLEDQQSISEVNQKKYKNQIDELMLQSRNRTLSEKERMYLIDKAMALENKAYNERKSIADNDYANTVQEAINNSRLGALEKQELKKRGVDYAIWLESKGKLDKGYRDKIKEAQGRQLDIINEGIQFEEKAQNRRDQLQDKEAQKAEQAQQIAEQQAQKSQQLAEQQAQKQAEIAQRIADATNELNNIKVQGELKVLKSISDNDKKTFDERLKAIDDYQAKQKTLIESNAEYEKTKKDITEKEIEVIEAKKQQNITDLQTESNKTRDDLQKKQLDETLKNYQKEIVSFKQTNEEKYQEELKNISKRYANEKISEEAYQKEKNELLKKYNELDYNNSIDTLNKELALQNLSKEQREAIEKALNESKVQYAKEANDAVIKADEEAANKRKEVETALNEKKKELFAQLQQTIADITNGYFQSRLQDIDAETKSVQDNATAQKEAVDNREKSGAISKEQAEKKKKSIDAQAKKDTDKLEAEKRKIAREQAIAERLFAVFSIGLSTAQAIMKNTAQLGLVPAIPVNIATGILGGLQIASAFAQPLPKASLGVLLRGRSHAQGGIPIEAEGGEAIINKRSTSMFAPILSLINQIGGGVPFSVSGNYLTDGGYAIRSYYDDQSIKDYAIEKAMENAVSKINVIATVEDIQRENKKYIEIENRANF